MGGLLVSGTGKDYRLFGMSDFHVLAVKDDGDAMAKWCQPSMPNYRSTVGASNSPPEGSCENSGKTIMGCCKASDRGTVGKKMDVSVFEIDPKQRYNHYCAVKGTGPAATLVDVTGVAVLTDAETKVQKYGFRSHFTSGVVNHVYDDERDPHKQGFSFTVIGTGLPQFEDGPPVKQGKSPNFMVSPANEGDFFNDCIRAPAEKLLAKLSKKKTGGGAGQVEMGPQQAKSAFTKLLNEGMIDGVFACPGDSGAWVMDGGNVVGLLHGGNWRMPESKTSSTTFQGFKLYPMYSPTYVYDATKMLAAANTYIRTQYEADTDANAHLNGLTLQVCAEGTRQKPSQDAPCAVLEAGGACNFPNACRFTAAGEGPGAAAASCAPFGVFSRGAVEEEPAADEPEAPPPEGGDGAVVVGPQPQPRAEGTPEKVGGDVL